MDTIWTPHIQIRSKSVVLYETADTPPNINRHQLSPYKTYSGVVTDAAAKRIRRTVDVFLQMTPKRIIYNPVTDKKQPFRLGFVTLTIAQDKRVSGKEGLPIVMLTSVTNEVPGSSLVGG